MSALSPRQKLFVENFLITGNATQSAKEAGYSPASAGEQGCKLLRNPLVTKEINEAEAIGSNLRRITNFSRRSKSLSTH